MNKSRTAKTAKHIGAWALALCMGVTLMTALGVEPTAFFDSESEESVYAATTVPGGTIKSNDSKETVSSVFGGKAEVTVKDNTTTITLTDNIALENPISFIKATLTGEYRIVINLDNHIITGPTSKDAIIIESFSQFFIDIVGPGSVIGGSGTVVTDENDTYGTDGGYGICFKNGIKDRTYYDYMSYNDLNCGLKIKGGASVIGGKGGTVTYNDWLLNLKNNSDSWKLRIYAGDGGCGIGSEYANRSSGSVREDGFVFAKYEIENGSVIGGAGGDVNIGDNTITSYALMKLQDMKTYLGNNNEAVIPKFYQGNGGDGIRFYGGRKYVNIAAGSSVAGGAGGAVVYGNTGILTTKSMSTSHGHGGHGINLYGDVGLNGQNPDYSCDSSKENYWGSKYSSLTSNSGEMGIYIAGTVTGGSTRENRTRGGSSPNPGDGIYLNLDSNYDGSDNTLGVIDVEGIVAGGNGGDSLRGGSSVGGNGIYEKSMSSGAVYVAKYYIINGLVKGGKGGTSWTPFYSLDESYVGNGGCGMSLTGIRADDADNERAVRNIAVGQNGSISGGDASTVLVLDDDAQNPTNGAKAIDGGISYYYDEVVKVVGSGKNNLNEGSSTTLIKNSDHSKNVKANISINNTELSCSVSAPNYNGKIFYNWTVITYDSSGGSQHAWTIESSGSDYSKFNLLRDSDYSNLLKSNIDAATVERIAKDLDMNRAHAEIDCSVILEDGRYVQAETITLPERWNGSGSSSGGGEDQSEDEQLAGSVEDMISAIGDIDYLDLDFDADYIDLVQEAYEELTDYQKSLVSQEAKNKLAAAVAKIAELRGEGIDSILADIDRLLPASEITTQGIAEEEAVKIQAINSKIENLTDAQMALLAGEDNAAALAKLDAVEQKVTEIIGGTAAHTHLIQHIPLKAGTCTTAGNIEHYRCMTCHKRYNNKEGTGDELQDADITTGIDANKHKYGAWKTVAAPTCSKEGRRECVCEYNNAHKQTETIGVDPNAHSWQAAGTSTAFYTDFYRTIRTDRCTGCGATRQGAVVNTNYKRNLPAVKIAKPKAAKKKLTAKWKKVSSKDKKKIAGIEIQVQGPGMDKVFTAGKGKTSKVIKVPKAKKKYKVRVRAYKGGGTGKQISKWSGWKTVKVK